jgi:3-carboxy-cis,cis-muconate cycloisomerase
LLEALASTGIAPPSAAEAAPSVVALDVDVRSLAIEAVAGGNPVIPLVTLVRAAVPPDVARWVHFGATSQDVLDTALMLVATDVWHQLDADLMALGDLLVDLCERGREVPVVGRTLTQQALPTTLGVRSAGWLGGVHDALDSLSACVLPASLGGPVGTASAYAALGTDVLHAYANALRLPATIGSWHTRRTPVTRLAHALCTVGAACGTLASDLLVMGQTEVGEAREGNGGPSSSMPHKANPVGSVLVVSAARQLPGLAAVLAASAVSEQDRPAGAWHAEWQPLRTMLRLAGAATERLATYLPDVRLDHDAMARNLDTLLAALGHERAWAAEQTAHTGLRIDEVVAEHERFR